MDDTDTTQPQQIASADATPAPVPAPTLSTNPFAALLQRQIDLQTQNMQSNRDLVSAYLAQQPDFVNKLQTMMSNYQQQAKLSPLEQLAQAVQAYNIARTGNDANKYATPGGVLLHALPNVQPAMAGLEAQQQQMNSAIANRQQLVKDALTQGTGVLQAQQQAAKDQLQLPMQLNNQATQYGIDLTKLAPALQEVYKNNAQMLNDTLSKIEDPATRAYVADQFTKQNPNWAFGNPADVASGVYTITNAARTGGANVAAPLAPAPQTRTTIGPNGPSATIVDPNASRAPGAGLPGSSAQIVTTPLPPITLAPSTATPPSLGSSSTPAPQSGPSTPTQSGSTGGGGTTNTMQPGTIIGTDVGSLRDPTKQALATGMTTAFTDEQKRVNETAEQAKQQNQYINTAQQLYQRMQVAAQTTGPITDSDTAMQVAKMYKQVFGTDLTGVATRAALDKIVNQLSINKIEEIGQEGGRINMPLFKAAQHANLNAENPIETNLALLGMDKEVNNYLIGKQGAIRKYASDVFNTPNKVPDVNEFNDQYFKTTNWANDNYQNALTKNLVSSLPNPYLKISPAQLANVDPSNMDDIDKQLYAAALRKAAGQ